MHYPYKIKIQQATGALPGPILVVFIGCVYQRASYP